MLMQALSAITLHGEGGAPFAAALYIARDRISGYMSKHKGTGLRLLEYHVANQMTESAARPDEL